MKQLLLLLIILPTFAEAQIKEHHITNTDLAPEEAFGTSVSVSDNYVAVGAYATDNETGSVLMYKGQGDNWVLQNTLVPEGAEQGDWVGMDIAMNQNYMVIGAPTDHWVAEKTGKAFVYELIDDEWVQSTILQPTDDYFQSAFGFIVNIHEDKIMVGAPDYDYSNGGLAIYEKEGDEWTVSHEFHNPNFDLNSFGCAFDMNDEWLAIGGYYTNFDSIENGNRFTIQMYQKQGMSWQESQRIDYEYQSLPYQVPSYTIGLSENQLLVGNHRPTDQENIDGELRSYTLNGDVWEEKQAIVPDGFELREVGRQVAIGEHYAMVGATEFNNIDKPHHILIYNTEINENWQLIADFSYEESASLNWQGFNIDINERYGVASSSHRNTEHGDVYVYDLRRFVNNEEILDDSEVSIYPIPSNTQLTIENKNEAISSYKIFGQLGQLVMAQDEMQNHKIELDVSSLPTGNYWIKVATKEGHLYRQFVKL